MKNLIKVLAISMALVMFAGLFAACGKKTEAPADTNDAPATDAPATEAAEGGELILGTSADYSPFEFIILDDKGEQQYVGIDISVAGVIAEDMGKTLKVSNMDFDSLMAALSKGDVDIVIAAIEETPERLEAADFSNPYYQDKPAKVLIKADKAEAYTSTDAFSGKSVGAQTGTTKANLVGDEFEGANLVALASVNDLVNQLVYDKIDAIVLDGAVAEQYAASNDDLVIASVELPDALPYCIAVQKGDPKGLLPSINATIEKLLSNDSIAAFSEAAAAVAEKAID
ncbi:MAG: transporter substrate-binding domain-containing protein [Clostridia bacterium]|nr:transporter substrate-binding domain-containing protein [Clostridia bacterium]